MHLLSLSISHFLNCFLTVQSSSTDFTFDEFSSSTSTGASLANSTNTVSQKLNNKKKNKKQQQQQQQQRKHIPMMRNGTDSDRGKLFGLVVLESLEFSALTPKALWTQLKNESKARYNYDLIWYERKLTEIDGKFVFSSDDIDTFIEEYSARRTCILRSFCLKTGLQLTIREYQFESNSKSSRATADCFNEDDIVNIYPIIKQVPPKVRLKTKFRLSLMLLDDSA